MARRAAPDERPRRRSSPASRARRAGAVIVVDGLAQWPEDLLRRIALDGHALIPAPDLASVLATIGDQPITALLLHARGLGGRTIVDLGALRARRPEVTIAVLIGATSPSDVRRAFESGATAVLPWPSPVQVLRRLLGRSGAPGARGRRPTPGAPPRPGRARAPR